MIKNMEKLKKSEAEQVKEEVLMNLKTQLPQQIMIQNTWKKLNFKKH